MSVSEKKQGLLVVVSGPAGSGKGTVIGELMRDENSCFSVSATTRAPRPGEINGVNYHFLTRKEFVSRIAAGDLLEYTEYCGNYYGTLKKQTEEDKLTIVITDGVPDGGPEQCKVSVNKLQQYAKVYGLAIGGGRDALTSIFGARCIFIDELVTLPRELCKIVERNILRR